MPRWPVDELFNDALSILGKTPVIETEHGDRGSGFGSIVDCLNLTIKLESKDLFASRLKRRHEFGAIVIPPIILKLCAIAIRRPSYRVVENTLPNWCSTSQSHAGPPGSDSVA